MARVKPVFRAADHPGAAGADTRDALTELFAFLAPGAAEPEIDKTHSGMAIAAQNPRLALHLARLTSFIALQTSWSRRPELIELTVQAVNLHFRSAFSFEARLPRAESTGLGLDRLAAIPYWRTSSLFDAEQSLILEYVASVVAGEVPENLFAAIRDTYGEPAAVELTTLIGCFSMWAMLINATAPDLG
ncbi:MAG: hypothetical protein ABIT04_08015 [Novosphingobium sp.]